MITATEKLDAIYRISELKARYFRFADTKDWEGLRGLFTADATMFFPEGQDAPLGRDESIARIKDFLQDVISIHHGHMPEINVLSREQATGIWAMEDLVYWPPDRAKLFGLESIHGYGHYHEDYVCRGGVWFIQKLKLTRLRLERRAPAVTVI